MPEPTSKAKTVFLFPNGNVAVVNAAGEQLDKIQGSVFDYRYIQRLACTIVRDRPEVNGYHPLVAEYVSYYTTRPTAMDEADESERDDERITLGEAKHVAEATVQRFMAEAFTPSVRPLIEAGDEAVQLLRQMFAPPPQTRQPTLGQLEQAIRTWDAALAELKFKLPRMGPIATSSTTEEQS
jgi:hypothetical protein